MVEQLHVVFGSGPAGRAVAAELAHQGLATRIVTAPHYHRWADEFPPLRDAVVDAASAAGARLVVLENLYMYGPTAGAAMTETTPHNPTGTKSEVRSRMSDELMEAHRRGRVEVAIGRAADFIGPGVTASAMGDLVFGAALAGKAARTMGRPDTVHSYSYVPDVGRNLVLLGSRAEAFGRAWHLPNPPARTTREIITDVYAAVDRPARITVLKRPTLRAIGLVNRSVRELLATYYQFDAPFIADHGAFTTAFGGRITGWDEIIQTTLASYRQGAPASAAGAPTRR